MTITKSENGNETTLSLEGWLDTQSAPQLQDAINELGDETESLIIDLEKLEYIASSGVRALVAAYKKMQGNLTVKNSSPEVMSIFKATGIDKKIRFE